MALCHFAAMFSVWRLKRHQLRRCSMGLEFVGDRAHWGYKFRFGLFQVSDSDMRLIAQAMRANLALLDL